VPRITEAPQATSELNLLQSTIITDSLTLKLSSETVNHRQNLIAIVGTIQQGEKNLLRHNVERKVLETVGWEGVCLMSPHSRWDNVTYCATSSLHHSSHSRISL